MHLHNKSLIMSTTTPINVYRSADIYYIPSMTAAQYEEIKSALHALHSRREINMRQLLKKDAASGVVKDRTHRAESFHLELVTPASHVPPVLPSLPPLTLHLIPPKLNKSENMIITQVSTPIPIPKTATEIREQEEANAEIQKKMFYAASREIVW
jgi:hypothetical protein